MTRNAALRLLVLVVLLAALGYGAVTDGGRVLAEANREVASLGMWAPPAFVLLYALVQLAFVPAPVLAASAGVLFGIPLGSATALAGATVGAALSFALARWLGRPAVARLAGSGRLARLDARLARRGFWEVTAVRLMPLFPFTLVSYGAGVTGMRFAPYLAGTVVGTLPVTLAFTGLGGALTDPASPVGWIAVAALVVLSVGGGWLARRGAAPAPPSEPPGPVNSGDRSGS